VDLRALSGRIKWEVLLACLLDLAILVKEAGMGTLHRTRCGLRLKLNHLPNTDIRVTHLTDLNSHLTSRNLLTNHPRNCVIREATPKCKLYNTQACKVWVKDTQPLAEDSIQIKVLSNLCK
jgi:hypothetical protein